MYNFNMRAREAKRILRCSYTTLHNYVKQGKLKAVDVGKKYAQYDDDSVQQLATSIYGDVEPKFKVTITKFGNISTFVLDERIVNKILDFITFELKNNAVEGMDENESKTIH